MHISKITRKASVAAISVLGLLGAVVASAPSSSATLDHVARSTAKVPVVSVKVGMTPYFEYQPFIIAHDLGLDAKMGLNLRVVDISGSGSLPTEELARGIVDIAPGCYSCEFPYIKSVPSIRDFMITNQFGGFIVIGRKGVPTYSQLVKTVGATRAKSAVLHSFVGKSFDLQVATYGPLIDGALKAAGISPATIHINSFANDAQAALAFEHGTGDYYMGSLPQEVTLLNQPGAKFVNVGGSEILGPAGLWYSTYYTTAAWLSTHEATALKLMAVWYRTMRYIRAYPAYAYKIWTADINREAAAHYSVTQVRYITTHLESYDTLQQAAAGEFNPKSALYYLRAAKYYSNPSAGSTIPSGAKVTTYIVEEAYFRRLLADKALVNWINSALVPPPDGRG